jgi:hypothetical protein
MSMHGSREHRASRLGFVCKWAAITGFALGCGFPSVAASQDISETETAYAGAILLEGDRSALIGEIGAGLYGDTEHERYLFWQGSSLFAGVIDEATNNRLDVVAEFYWFEPAVSRGSDFYVVVLKVTAAPAPNTGWRIATPPSEVDSLLGRDIGPVHRVQATVDRSGQHGAIRWDWCVPFQNYRWEPSRVIEVEQSYSIGARVEGGAMKSLSEDVNIQAKGFLDVSHRVTSRYTITLWRWEMRVQAGATDIDWNLTALDPDHEHDPGYHEYFLVLQSEKGVPVQLERLQFATTLRERNLPFIQPDNFLDLSLALTEIVLIPPAHLDCPEGQHAVDNECIDSCPEGFDYVDGECLDACDEGEIRVGTDCLPDCDPDERLEDGECVPACDEGFEHVDGQCVPDCEDGFVPEGNRCVPDCQDGYRPEGDICVLDCAPGTEAVGDECLPECGQYERRDGTDCVLDCPPGTVASGEECVVELTCEEGFHREADACVPDSCGVDSDCLRGSYCGAAGTCKAGCDGPSDCPRGFLCTSDARCVSAGTGDSGGDSSGCGVSRQASYWAPRFFMRR